MATWTATLAWRDRVPAIVLLVGLAFTTIAAASLHREARAKDAERFRQLATRSLTAIDERIDTVIAMLRATAGLIVSQGEAIDARMFRAYADQLALRSRYPGVQGIGYSMRVTDAQRGAVEAKLRASAGPEARLWPSASAVAARDSGTQAHAIVLIEPLDARNRAALGYDMSSEPVRRAAMERARDSGLAAASGAVTLVQEIDADKQPGFLLYFPVYAGGVTPPSVEARRAALRGHVYTPFRARDLFADLLADAGQGLGFRIYDSEEREPSRLLHATSELDQLRPGGLRLTERLDVAGQRWTIEVIALPGFAAREFNPGLAALAGGTLVSLMLAGLAWTQVRASRADAQRRREREQLLASERAARAEAEQANRIKDDFLATISHELRTPLNAILGWVQVLHRRGGLPPEASEGLAVIERNARAQAHLIEDLLDSSRIIAGKLRLEPQPVDASELAAATVETVRPAAIGKGIAIEKRLAEQPLVVSADPARLQQIFWNLLTNAVKFTPRGGRIVVGTTAAGERMRVTVSDSGPGVARELVPHLFDRFRQADSSITRSHGGLGLGLSIAKTLVELHGGRIGVRDPREGVGATFVVELPLAPSDDATLRMHSPTTAAFTSADDPCERLNAMRVLVVDDDADARGLVDRLLRECDAEVLHAANAAEAFETLRRARPDVLVSDIGMPGEDGYSLMRRVRRLPPEQGGATPAVALTAFGRAEERERAMAAGFGAHLRKPVNAAELIATVARLGRRAHAPSS